MKEEAMKAMANPLSLRAGIDMAISNAMAVPRVWTGPLPLPELPFCSSHVRTSPAFCYRRLHHVARATGPLPFSPSPSAQPSIQDVVQKGTPMEKLILEIRDELASIESRDMKSRETLNEALLLVDLIQRLGIQRHFDHLIDGILHSTYRVWREESGLVSPGLTVLAFRLLRLKGYHVSADVIEALKDINGEFSCFSIQTHEGVSEMLNLYRCSQTAFPFEADIMNQANQFARAQLHKTSFALEYPRQCLLQRLESRNIVKQLWPGDGTINNCLELAKLDMEMLQKLHNQEIEEVKRWWAKLGVSGLAFAKRAGRIEQIHFAVSVDFFEQQYSAFRLAYVKTATLNTLLDDLFDLQYSQSEELNCFSKAIQRWDPSILDDLPIQKAVYGAMYSTMMEVAEESSKVQGHDLLPFLKNLWEVTVSAVAKEAERKHTHHTPTLEDYMRVAEVSIGAIVCVLMSIFLMGEIITNRALHCIGKDSRFMHLASVIGRLSNDIVTFKREQREGEMASSISCYMRDNPQCTQEEAIAFLIHCIESTCREIEWEHFQSRALVPECCSRLLLNFARTTSFVYKRADAFSNASDGEYEKLFRDYLYNPLLN